MLSSFKTKIFSFLLIGNLLLQVAHVQAQKGNHTFAFYNVENLFDTEDDPAIDDAEYLPTSELKWEETRLATKFNRIARVLDSLGDADGPEIIGFAEIENRQVVEMLLNHDRLKSKKYQLVHFDSPDARGIDVGIAFKSDLYKLNFAKPLAVTLKDEPNFATRDILLAQFSAGKTHFYVLANHWPSRRGGEETSRPKRQAAAEVARITVDSILSRDPQAKIMLIGDFNDEPFDSPVQFLVNGISGSTALINAMEPLKRNNVGSLYFQKKPNLIDQIIFSPGFVNPKSKYAVLPASASVFNPTWLQESDERFAGQPFRTFSGKKYLGGYSDHFPVFIHVKP